MTFPNSSEIKTDVWVVGEQQKSQRGLSYCMITCNSKPAVFQLTSLTEPMLTPWGASSFKDEQMTRLNLDVNLDEHPKLQEILAKVDEWAKTAATSAGLRGEYKPLVMQQNVKYPARLRMKIAMTGQHAARLWNTNKQPIVDTDLRGARIVPVVQFSKLWQVSGMTGITCELKHAIVENSQAECPVF